MTFTIERLTATGTGVIANAPAVKGEVGLNFLVARLIMDLSEHCKIELTSKANGNPKSIDLFDDSDGMLIFNLRYDSRRDSFYFKPYTLKARQYLRRLIE